ncbi:hypothetical protein HK099_006825 [Clydaea vesicula]|uniref:Uncharacterized protein n=1 Tax=Clydaea vesicula TaxID=447962 RepID=A0AAD5XWS6_9FUNG|nr:hypothetical protein HK099_006825 [Clydaea vesicula]
MNTKESAANFNSADLDFLESLASDKPKKLNLTSSQLSFKNPFGDENQLTLDNLNLNNDKSFKAFETYKDPQYQKSTDIQPSVSKNESIKNTTTHIKDDTSVSPFYPSHWKPNWQLEIDLSSDYIKSVEEELNLKTLDFGFFFNILKCAWEDYETQQKLKTSPTGKKSKELSKKTETETIVEKILNGEKTLKDPIFDLKAKDVGDESNEQRRGSLSDNYSFKPFQKILKNLKEYYVEPSFISGDCIVIPSKPLQLEFTDNLNLAMFYIEKGYSLNFLRKG